MAPLGALVRFGSMERAFSAALDGFNSTNVGLAFPKIGPQWRSIHQTPLTLSSSVYRDFVASARRMTEDAQMLAAHYREYQSRVSRDATARFTTGREDDEVKIQQQREREHFAEMTGNLSANTRTTLTPGRTFSWYLALTNFPGARQDLPHAVFVNEDGRGLHFSQLYGDSVLFGYGVLLSGMHYLEIGPGFPLGRSRVLFLKDTGNRGDLGFVGFLGLCRSLLTFYSPQTLPISGKIRVSEVASKMPKYASPSVDLNNEGDLKEVFRRIAGSGHFSIETEEIVAGRRGSSLATINATVPLGSIRYETIEGQAAAIYRTYYLPERLNSTGETAIPEEYRKRLRHRAS